MDESYDLLLMRPMLVGMMMKDSLFLLISNVLGRGCGAREGGPLMMMKESMFLLVSNVLGSGCRAGEGAN